jgi:hypothetical protein
MRRPALLLSFLGLLATGVPATGCKSGGIGLITLMPGVVNDPANRTLRREIIQFGNEQFCKEMQKRGIPIRMRDDEPIIGRFFATTCSYREIENGDIFVQFSGIGYAWTKPSGRIGYEASGSVQYNPDFFVEKDALYAYFRPRNVQSTEFKTKMVEVTSGGGLASLGIKLGEDTANRMGAQIINQEIGKGFTVIREGNGSVDFGLGIVERGGRPFHPYQIKGSDRATLANERSETHAEQRDFIGPLEIDDSGRALFLTMKLDGAPAADILILPKDTGDAWLYSYIGKAGTPALTAPVLLGDTVSSQTEYRRTVPLRKGLYYLVIDHSSNAGPTAPPPPTAGIGGVADIPATVSYVVQVGDAP